MRTLLLSRPGGSANVAEDSEKAIRNRRGSPDSIVSKARKWIAITKCTFFCVKVPRMADAELWLHVVASIGAIIEVVKYGAEYTAAFARKMDEPATNAAAQKVSLVLSTYSDDEVEQLLRRIKRCRDHFIDEGSGIERVKCMCSVLRDIKDGNGGDFPLDEWEELFRQLKCGN